ncbi:MAG: hypothetical protein ACKPKO_50510, partial [Candidatus Fonsibacter sp.]
IVESLRKQNIISDTFTFIDATAVVSKSNIWEARDKAIEDKQKTLNNSNIEKYSSDPHAKIGCKGGSKFWYGYKRTQAVDMKHGIIPFWKILLSPSSPKLGLRKGHIKVFFRLKWYFGIRFQREIPSLFTLCH